MLKSYPPIPKNVTVFGDKVFKEVIKVKLDHMGGPFQYNWCPYKKKLGQR